MKTQSTYHIILPLAFTPDTHARRFGSETPVTTIRDKHSLLRVYSQLATSHRRDNVIRIVARSKMTDVATVVLQEWQRPRSGGTGRLQPLRRGGKKWFESSFIYSFVHRLRQAFVKCSMNLCWRYEGSKIGLRLIKRETAVNPLNPELNPIYHLLALLVHFLHVSRIRVKSLTIRLLMSYIFGAPILDVSKSHTTRHHSR